jgi:hypothetical protein
MRSVDRLFRAGQAFGGQQCCEHAVAGGVAGGGAFPHRQLAAAGGVQRDVGRHRKRDGLGDPGTIEPQNPGGADGAGDGSVEYMVEAAVAHGDGAEQAGRAQ